jgi:hypothetical protein
MTVDCLICLAPLRATWRPPHTAYCFCRPPVHQACWTRWVEYAGPTCLICRYRPQPAVVYYNQRPVQRPLIAFICNDPQTLLFYIAIASYIMVLLWRWRLVVPTGREEL